MAITTRKKPTTREVPDGDQFLSSYQAAQLCNVKLATLTKWTQLGYLHPARFGTEHIFTRAEILAVRNEQTDRQIGKLLAEGVAPTEVWERLPHVSIDRVVRVLRSWARLSGYWVVEAPPGSYARWLSRFGLTRCTARDLRRHIERLLEHGPPSAKLAAHPEDRSP
jgi:hypothetical protein